MKNKNNKQYLSSEDAKDLTLSDAANTGFDFLYEEKDKREKNVKHFRKKDGNIVAMIYDHPIHKIDQESGTLVDIVSSLKEDEENFAASFEKYSVKFPKITGDKKYSTLSKGDKKLSWRLLSKEIIKRKSYGAYRGNIKQSPWEIIDQHIVRYAGVDSTSDVEYIATERGIKENIVLAKMPKNTIFTFELVLEGIKPILSDNKQKISFANDKDEVEFIIPASFMIDSNNSYCESITYALRETKGKLLLDLIADKEWIYSSERVYPITIDPAITIPDDNSGLATVGYCSSSSTGNNSTISKKIGVMPNGDIYRMFIGFDTLPPLDVGHKIVKAGFSMHQFNSSYLGSKGDYYAACSFDRNNKDMSNIGNYMPTDFQTVSLFEGKEHAQDQVVDIDITNLVSDIYNGKDLFRGIMIKKDDESIKYTCYTDDSGNQIRTPSDTYVEFYAAGANNADYRPSMYIEYTNGDAYIDHQKNHTFDMGSAGKGIVNLSNGHLIFSHLDTILNKKLFPIPISHVYRPQFTETKNGRGWYLSIEQTVEEVFYENLRAKYTDAQGKQHWFVWDENGNLVDDMGLNLRYHTDSDYVNQTRIHIITDTNNRSMHFDGCGRLFKITEPGERNIGEKIRASIEYTGNNVSKLTYNNMVCFFNYTDGKLSSITYGGKYEQKYIYFTYTGDNLTCIKHYNQNSLINSVSFEYTNNLLTKILDFSGKGYTVAYDSNGRVSRLTPIGTLKVMSNGTTASENLSEDSIVFEYRKSSTAVMNDRTKAKVVYKFDSNGRIVSEYTDNSELIDATKRYKTTLSEIYEYKPAYNEAELSKQGKYCSLAVASTTDYSDDNNLISEGCFENTGTTNAWKPNQSLNTVDSYIPGQKALSLVGNNEVSQTITLSQADIDGNMLLASGWAKIPTPNFDELLDSKFRIKLKLTQQDGTREEVSADFDMGCTKWQYAAVPFALDSKKTYTSATVTLECTGHTGSCLFTNIRLIATKGKIAENTYGKNIESLSSFGTAYNINQINTVNDGYTKTQEYINENFDVVVKRITIPNCTEVFNSMYEYDYMHNLLRSKDFRGIVTENTYDENNNITSTKTYHQYSPARYKYVEYTYDAAGNVTSETEPRYNDGNDNPLKTVNTYNEDTDLLTSTTDASGQIYSYQYDAATEELLKMYTDCAEMQLKNEFEYCKQYPVKYKHNEFFFGFDYDALGRKKSVNIDGVALVTKEFSKTSSSDSIKNTYATGEEATVTSDIFGNPIVITYKHSSATVATPIAEMQYNEAGEVKNTLDKETNICYTYTYDKYGNVVNEAATGTPTNHNTAYVYDTQKNRVESVTYGAVGHKYNSIYEQSSRGNDYPDNTQIGIELEGKFSDETTRDKLSRISGKTLNVGANTLITDSYEFVTSNKGSDTIETDYISKHTQNVGTEHKETNYEYDSNGNIVYIEYGSPEEASVYYYDSCNRLVKEINDRLGKTYEWTYDACGNILTKTTYSNLSPSVPEKVDVYSYATIGNRDRLISFNNECFTYNELGNPICYRNHTLSWERMSLLASYDGNTFEYNASGIRCKKNNTVYTLSGKRILKETNGSNTIVYYYGVNGVVGFNYNGTDYYYGRNLLGDITEIYTAAGVKVASYVYDAWGVCTIVFDTSSCNISAINPFRYRGYYFDTETNLYYLETRYYDPQIGRFVSQDNTKFLSPKSLGGFNLFAYCLDNPIMSTDPTGKISVILAMLAMAAIGAVVGAISSAATASYSYKIENPDVDIDSKEYKAAIIGAAVSGAISGGISGAFSFLGQGGVLLAGIIGGGLGNVVGKVVEQSINGQLFGEEEILTDSLWGAAGGAIGALVAGPGGASATAIFAQYFKHPIKNFISNVGENLIMGFTDWYSRAVVEKFVDSF